MVSFTQVQSPHALGRMDFMAGYRIAVDLRCIQPDGKLAPRLNPVHMHRRPIIFRLDRLGKSRYIQYGTHFVVHMHGRYQRGPGANCIHKFFRMHMTVPVRRHHGDAPAILFQRGHRILHRRVLVPGDDHMIGPGAARFAGAEHRNVVCLGAAGGKVNFAGLCSQ